MQYRYIEIFENGKTVHRTEVTGKDENSIERVLRGMMTQMRKGLIFDTDVFSETKLPTGDIP